MAAVKSIGYALEYASDQLKSEFNIVMEAIKQCGWALKYASKGLRGNKEIVLAAHKHNIDVFQFINQKVFIISIVHHLLEYHYNTKTNES